MNDRLTKTAKRRIDERRYAAEEKAAETLEYLRKNERWIECEQQLRSAQVSLAMGEGGKQLAKKIAELESKQRKLLDELGISPEELTPQYSCKLCNDTGYVNGKPCRCLQEELHRLIVAGSNAPNAEFTFENSTEKEEKNLAVYDRMRKLLQNKSKNALIVGKVGTGKTYLLTACANYAAAQGRSVLFVTAYSLNADFLSACLDGSEAVNALMDSLIEADLLLIDDLGTEKLFNNVTANFLFALLNERTVNKKQTFFTSNLSLGDISERYDERIVSRLMDKNTAFVAQLAGEDKRLAKR